MKTRKSKDIISKGKCASKKMCEFKEMVKFIWPAVLDGAIVLCFGLGIGGLLKEYAGDAIAAWVNSALHTTKFMPVHIPLFCVALATILHDWVCE